MTKTVIIGASSGIGRELARVAAARGHLPGLAARRYELLVNLQDELGVPSHSKEMDLSRPQEAVVLLRELIGEMGGADIIIICSGICHRNIDLEWEKERETIAVNALGFAAMADAACDYFRERGRGHIVGISSFRGARGGWSAPAYNASKAFVSNYLEGLRVNLKRTGRNIAVTDIRPGLVDTSMTGLRTGFLVAPVKEVAVQIWDAIEKGKETAFVPGRFRAVYHLMQMMPDWIYGRLPAAR